MLKGFIRTSNTGRNKRQQQAALKSVGITDLRLCGSVYENEGEAAIASLQPGDVLVVSEPSRLGVSTVDVMSAIEAVGKRGASVVRADTGEILSWSPDAQLVISFAVEAERRNRRDIAANARKVAAEMGKTGVVPKIVCDRKKFQRLKAIDKVGILTRDQMAEKLGISRASLMRKLAELKSNKGAQG